MVLGGFCLNPDFWYFSVKGRMKTGGGLLSRLIRKTLNGQVWHGGNRVMSPRGRQK